MITDEPKENTPRILVACAAIVNVQAKRLFVQRRDGETSYPWHHCTPGGKANPRETFEEALRRELFEEHGVCLKCCHWVVDPVYVHDIVSTRTGELMRVTCSFVPSHAILGEYKAGPSVAGFDWVTADELETLTLTPADDANRGKLMALLR